MMVDESDKEIASNPVTLRDVIRDVGHVLASAFFLAISAFASAFIGIHEGYLSSLWLKMGYVAIAVIACFIGALCMLVSATESMSKIEVVAALICCFLMILWTLFMINFL